MLFSVCLHNIAITLENYIYSLRIHFCCQVFLFRSARPYHCHPRVSIYSYYHNHTRFIRPSITKLTSRHWTIGRESIPSSVNNRLTKSDTRAINLYLHTWPFGRVLICPAIHSRWTFIPKLLNYFGRDDFVGNIFWHD